MIIQINQLNHLFPKTVYIFYFLNPKASLGNRFGRKRGLGDNIIWAEQDLCLAFQNLSIQERSKKNTRKKMALIVIIQNQHKILISDLHKLDMGKKKISASSVQRIT